MQLCNEMTGTTQLAWRDGEQTLVGGPCGEGPLTWGEHQSDCTRPSSQHVTSQGICQFSHRKCGMLVVFWKRMMTWRLLLTTRSNLNEKRKMIERKKKDYVDKCQHSKLIIRIHKVDSENRYYMLNSINLNICICTVNS